MRSLSVSVSPDAAKPVEGVEDVAKAVELQDRSLRVKVVVENPLNNLIIMPPSTSAAGSDSPVQPNQ